jgi:hypothetical protein
MEDPVSGAADPSRRTTGGVPRSPQGASRPSPQADQAEERSLDLVQRMVISALIIVVFGLFAAMLAAYIAIYPEESSRSSTIGLWAMSGVFGLASAAAVLVVNRRRPYSPWVILGLVPMAVAAFWVF